MPKGVKSKVPGVLKSVAGLMVPPNAKNYPGTQSAEHPEGVPLPDGIRVRTGRGVEVRFIYRGERISETVRGKPTVEFVAAVSEKRERIIQTISLGKFNDEDYRREFPDSSRFCDEDTEEPKVYTVGQALEDWFSSRLCSFGENTERDYRLAIRNQIMPMKLSSKTREKAKVSSDEFVKPAKAFVLPQEWLLSRYEGGPVTPVDPHDHELLCHLPLARLNDVLLNAIRSQWLDAGISVKRVNNLFAPLRGAIERAYKMKLIDCNPIELLKPLRKKLKEERSVRANKREIPLDAPLPDDDATEFLESEGKPDPFTTDEMHAIISELDGPMANQFTFAFWTGLRTGELIALRLSDVQLHKAQIRVRRSLSRGVLKSSKTDNERWVHLLPPALAALKAQLELFGAPDGWVFPNPFTKTRWANDSKITKRWKRALEAANVRYRRPYQTRHTFASLLLSSGEHMMHVAKQMGHADWSMLVKVYGRWMPTASVAPAGASISKVQQGNWERLQGLLDAQAAVVAHDDDYEDEEDDSEVEVF